MPNRIIKETINESRSLAELSPFAQDLFKRLITYADDYGRFNADLDIMRARLYPLELDAIATDDVRDGLVELCGIEKICFYREPMNGHQVLRMYGYLKGWENHQRVRDSRSKFPAPTECYNDWAFQRFVPIQMKVAIFERDKFICQKCKKNFQLKGLTTRQAMRALASVFHIDHVVPIIQGGRATMENLRLLCASCNLSRRHIIHLEELRQLAASRGETPLLSESESNPNPNLNPTLRLKAQVIAGFDRFWLAYPRKKSKLYAQRAWYKIKPNEQLQDRIFDALERAKTSGDWTKEHGRFIPHPATWLNAHGWEDEFLPPANQLMDQAHYLMGHG